MLSERLLRALSRNSHALTCSGAPPRPADRQLARGADGVEAREDAWLAEAKAIDPATNRERPLRATYAIVRQTLEGDAAKRVCRDELWNVSQMTGWQVNLGYLVTIQPSAPSRRVPKALARWTSLPKYIDTEIANLREGLRLGYTAPTLNVRIVIDQVRTLATTPLKDSPFASPGQRDKTPAFRQQFDALVTGASTRRRKVRGLPRAGILRPRATAIAVSANPNGSACYDASVLYHSSVPKTARQVYELGVQQNDRLMEEMKVIGARCVRDDRRPGTAASRPHGSEVHVQEPRGEDRLLAGGTGPCKRHHPGLVARLPRADVVITPYPAFREKNAPNEYSPPAEDGSRPAVFFISAYQAERQSRVEDESTAFHETIPATICRVPSRSSGRTSIRSAVHLQQRYVEGGRSMPSAWRTR